MCNVFYILTLQNHMFNNATVRSISGDLEEEKAVGELAPTAPIDAVPPARSAVIRPTSQGETEYKSITQSVKCQVYQ